MLVRVLGPLVVSGADVDHPVRPPRAARTLARLTVDAGRFVESWRIADSLWTDDEMPRNPDRAVSDAVLDLRRFLRATAHDLVETRADGRAYRVVLGDDELDSAAALVALRAAESAERASALDDAHRRYVEVLAHFRGTPYEQFGTEAFAVAERTRLEAVRWSAIEGHVTTAVELGDTSVALDIAPLAHEQPQRWRLWAAWMLAMARSGRQADALDVFQRARAALAERGLDPPPQLVELDRTIAQGTGPDPRTTRTAPTPPRFPPVLDLAAHELIGREHQLAALHEAWEATQTGAPAFALLTGDEGIGKTALAAAFGRQVADSGVLVLYGRCDQDGTEAYEPFTQALEWCIADMSAAERDELLASEGGFALLRLLPALATEAVPAPETTGQARADQLRLFRSTTAVLEHLASRRPVVVVADDLHWADDATLALVRHVVRTVASDRLMLVLALRPAEAAASPLVSATLAELARRPSLVRVPLVGLDRESIAALVGTTTGAPPPSSAVTDRLERQTEGNPLFVLEVARQLDGEGRHHDQPGPVPEGIRDLTHRRLAGLSPTALRVLDVAAVIGPGFSVRTLEAVEGVGDRGVVLDALDEIRPAALLSEQRDDPDQLLFRHGYYRDVVYEKMAPSRRADWHRRVALALERQDDQVSPRVVVHHLLAAGALGDPARVVVHATAAGRRALARLDADDAIAVLQRALALAEQAGALAHHDAAPAYCVYAEALARAGDVPGSKAAARSAWDHARAAGDEGALVAAALAHASFGLGEGEDPVSVALLVESQDLVHGAERAAQLKTRLAYHLSMWADWRADIGTLVDEALRVAEAAGSSALIDEAVYASAIAQLGRPGRATRVHLGERLVHDGTAQGSERTIANGLRVLCLATLEGGDLEQCADLVEQLDRLAERTGSWMYAVDVARLQAALAMTQGEWEAAETWIELYRQRAMKVSEHVRYEISHAGQRLLLHHERGELAEARAVALRALEQAPHLVVVRAAVGLFDAERGDVASATSALADLADERLALRCGRTYSCAVGMLADIAARVQATEYAGVLASALEPFAGHLMVVALGEGCLGAADRYRGLVAALGGDQGRALVLLQRALELETAAGAAPSIARTSAWMARLGQGEQAERHRSRAASIAERLGMRGLLADLERDATYPDVIGSPGS